MALNNLGLGMIIRAKDTASAVFARVGKSIVGVRAGINKMGAGLATMGGSLRGVAMGFAPFTIGMGLGLKKAADFEQGMQNVSAVLKGVSDKDFKALSTEAKRIGAVTAFSAVQATDGMTMLARAGFDAEQSIAALGPVVNAASADGIELAQSANTVVIALKSMGLEAKDAGKAADILAQTSSMANTDMVGLGEGLKMAGPQAKTLGVSLADTTAALGLLADAGLKGTMGGSNLNAMLTKLTRPTKKAEAGFKELGVEIGDADGNMRPLGDLMADVGKNIHKLGGNLDQGAFLAEAFGIRGGKAANILATKMSEMAGKMTKDKDGPINALDLFFKKIRQSDGAAKTMAEIRLKSLKGAFTILGSSIEGVAIEAFGGLSKAMGPAVKGFADFVGEIAAGVGLLGEDTAESRAKFQGLSKEAQSMALGIRDAMETIKSAASTVKDIFKALGSSMESAFGQDGLRTITKWVAVAVTLMAVLGPIAAALAAIGFVLGPVITFIGGFITFASGLGSVLVGLGGIIWTAISAVGAFVASLASSLAPAVMTAIGGLKTLALGILSAARNAAVAAAGGIRVFAAAVVRMAAAAAASAGRALVSLGLAFNNVMRMSVTAAARGLGLFIARTVKMGAVAVASGVKGLAALAAQFVRTAAAAAAAAAKGIVVFIASTVKMAAVAIASAVKALIAMIAKFVATGAAASGAASGGILAMIVNLGRLAALQVASAMAGMAAALKGVGASAAAAAVPVAALLAAVASLVVAWDQWSKLSNELGDSGWSDMWKKLKKDVGYTTQQEYEREIGIQQDPAAEKFREGQAATAAKSVMAAAIPELPGPGQLPGVGAAEGQQQTVAAINNLGENLAGQPITMDFQNTTTLTLDGNVLATQIDKRIEQDKARGSR
jgi:TP901 family phage tail tape measure protein